jgi:hypothetical protein
MRRRQAKGTADETHNGFKAIAVRFDDASFAQIGSAAERNRVSFAEQVRTYVKLGMGVDNEMSEEEQIWPENLTQPSP